MIAISEHVVVIMMMIMMMKTGEEKLSYGYGGTGKASTDCRFSDYGRPFAKDDVITAYVVSLTPHQRPSDTAPIH